MPDKIICIHIGARAHYLLPKALNSQGRLEMMITDTWVKKSWIRKLLAAFPMRLVKSFSNRYTAAIEPGKVQHFSIQFLITELLVRYKYKDGWPLIIARNNAFQKKALPLFLQLPKTTVLGTSYTSLTIFKAAAERGQKKILFQIDPGVKEEKIVAAITEEHAALYPSSWQKAPATYWEDWKKECGLSDIIMVNSDWSRQGLVEEGIEASKIKIVDLPYQLGQQHLQFQKIFPAAFTKDRPLRCLFLGTLTLRKGIHIVLQTAGMLQQYPVEFIIVGHSEINESLLQAGNIKYKGLATRAETDNFYREADVFLFPTLSDGFGLTQLEAMAWQVPVVASRFCAPVVKDKENGITLAENTPAALAAMLKEILGNPGILPPLSANCLSTVKEYSIQRFADELAAL